MFLDLSSKMRSHKPNNNERVPYDFYGDQIVVLYDGANFTKLYLFYDQHALQEEFKQTKQSLLCYFK